LELLDKIEKKLNTVMDLDEVRTVFSEVQPLSLEKAPGATKGITEDG
jgi:hypothetical protein